jgi:hypothetical protein
MKGGFSKFHEKFKYFCQASSNELITQKNKKQKMKASANIALFKNEIKFTNSKKMKTKQNLKQPKKHPKVINIKNYNIIKKKPTKKKNVGQIKVNSKKGYQTFSISLNNIKKLRTNKRKKNAKKISVQEIVLKKNKVNNAMKGYRKKQKKNKKMTIQIFNVNITKKRFKPKRSVKYYTNTIKKKKKQKNPSISSRSSVDLSISNQRNQKLTTSDLDMNLFANLNKKDLNDMSMFSKNSMTLSKEEFQKKLVKNSIQGLANSKLNRMQNSSRYRRMDDPKYKNDYSQEKLKSRMYWKNVQNKSSFITNKR